MKFKTKYVLLILCFYSRNTWSTDIGKLVVGSCFELQRSLSFLEWFSDHHIKVNKLLSISERERLNQLGEASFLEAVKISQWLRSHFEEAGWYASQELLKRENLGHEFAVQLSKENLQEIFFLETNLSLGSGSVAHAQVFVVPYRNFGLGHFALGIEGTVYHYGTNNGTLTNDREGVLRAELTDEFLS